jgi:hypothetical protein
MQVFPIYNFNKHLNNIRFPIGYAAVLIWINSPDSYSFFLAPIFLALGGLSHENIYS